MASSECRAVTRFYEILWHVDLMGSDPFMTATEARTQTFLASTNVSRGSDPIKSTDPWPPLVTVVGKRLGVSPSCTAATSIVKTQTCLVSFLGRPLAESGFRVRDGRYCGEARSVRLRSPPFSRTHRVHDSQATEELAVLIAGFGTNNKMPVIALRYHGINLQRHYFPRLFDRMRKRGIVLRLFKNRQPNHRPIENVEDFNCRTTAFRACHPRSPTQAHGK